MANGAFNFGEERRRLSSGNIVDVSSGGGFRRPAPLRAPTFRQPSFDPRRVSALTQQKAAPGLRRLETQARRFGLTRAGEGSAAGEQARRGLEGFGQGVSDILGSAQQAATQQFVETELQPAQRAAEIGFQGKLAAFQGELSKQMQQAGFANRQAILSQQQNFLRESQDREERLLAEGREAEAQQLAEQREFKQQLIEEQREADRAKLEEARQYEESLQASAEDIADFFDQLDKESNEGQRGDFQAISSSSVPRRPITPRRIGAGIGEPGRQGVTREGNVFQVSSPFTAPKNPGGLRPLF